MDRLKTTAPASYPQNHNENVPPCQRQPSTDRFVRHLTGLDQYDKVIGSARYEQSVRLYPVTHNKHATSGPPPSLKPPKPGFQTRLDPVKNIGHNGHMDGQVDGQMIRNLSAISLDL